MFYILKMHTYSYEYMHYTQIDTQTDTQTHAHFVLSCLSTVRYGSCGLLKFEETNNSTSILPHPLVYLHWSWWSCTETKGPIVTLAVACTSDIVARPTRAVYPKCMMMFSLRDLQCASRSTRQACVK